MSTSKKHYSPMQWIHISITLLLMFGFGHLPTFASVTPVGMKILGIFLGVIYGYSTCEVIWPSLFAFIAFGTSGYAASFNAAIASMMGSGTVFQIITQYFCRCHHYLWIRQVVRSLVLKPESIPRQASILHLVLHVRLHVVRHRSQPDPHGAAAVCYLGRHC